MYERSYGYKYAEHQGLTNAQVAAKIRADIKTAIKEGLLPAGWKYSVRTRSFAGGGSIDVRVKDCPDAWTDCPGYKGNAMCANYWCRARCEIARDEARLPHTTEHKVLSEIGEAARITLERIHGAYNHDGSDIMTDYFDVNYYGGVNFEGGH